MGCSASRGKKSVHFASNATINGDSVIVRNKHKDQDLLDTWQECVSVPSQDSVAIPISGKHFGEIS
jgi:hypothetical protein